MSHSNKPTSRLIKRLVYRYDQSNTRLNGLLIFLLACIATSIAPSHKTCAGTVIQGALVFDGSAQPGKSVSVRIENDRISAIGIGIRRPDDQIIDASGLVLAPGFIDTHSHHDIGLEQDSSALAAITQGITTVVLGQDGESHYPLQDFFLAREQHPATINIASYSGHNTLRMQAMGLHARAATTKELKHMQHLLEQDLKAGALGLSTGLEYNPGLYATTAEVMHLAKVTAAHKGRYISHIRSEDVQFWSAIDELLDIGQKAQIPVQISHIKLARRSLWGQAPQLLEKLNKARKRGIDVTADIYPYTFWQSTLEVLFPQRDFTDLKAAQFALTELSSPQDMRLTLYSPQPSLVGKTFAQIALQRNESAAHTYLWLINHARAYAQKNGHVAEQVMGVSMNEKDIRNLIAWPHTNLCSDGALNDGHPRGAGSFTRFFARYVTPVGDLTLADAVRKVSALAAEHMGIKQRGYIRPGYFADLVLFNPATITDRATVDEPGLLSRGIEKVWVNGKAVLHKGQATSLRPGRVIRRVK